MVKFKTPKNELAYSEMTDKVYWYKGNGQRQEVSNSFMYILFLMAKRWAKGEKSKGFKQRFTNPDDPEDSWEIEVKAKKIGKKEDVKK